MTALVGLVAGVLLIAGVGSLVLTRSSARRQATEQLVTEAQSLTAGASHQSVVVLRAVRRVLRLEDATFVRIDPQGAVTSGLPPDISSSALNAGALLDGETVSGRSGNLVFAAAPVTLTGQERVRLHVRGQVAILLTRQVGGLGPSWMYFVLAGGVALVVAALVAWQMSRRMSRPLVEAVEVTGRIAAGDLQSRVPVRERDYPEVSSLAGSINAMAQSLADNRERERHLLLSVSHDLRTPLTSIRGYAEAITDGAVMDTSQAARVIIAESHRLQRLVGDLLDLAKLQARQLSMHIRPTDGPELVGMAVMGFRPLAEGMGVDLTSVVPTPGADPLAADPDRLSQLLANLIENALTHARSSVTVSMVASDDPRRPHVQHIVVEDDGAGIAAGELDRVFDRFYQADQRPNRQMGSGLGLAIVAELAAAMGGSVGAESPVGAAGGSRFIVTLPTWSGSPAAGSPKASTMATAFTSAAPGARAEHDA